MIFKNKSVTILYMMIFLFTAMAVKFSYGQPLTHDPSSIVRDGSRYWIFCTNVGIGRISASNPDFTDWHEESSVFGSTWPSWINNYVPEFGGHFWAPSCKYFNGKYHLYYSCSTFGKVQSAIGLVTSPSLNNPNWTDHGMVVYSTTSSDHNEDVTIEVNILNPFTGSKFQV